MKYLQLAVLVGLMGLSSTGFESSFVTEQPLELVMKAKEPQLVKPESIRGCYELGALRWRPDLKLGKDAVFITPPAKIQILTEKGTVGFEKDEYLVRPAPGTPPSVHRASYWKSTGASTIELIWTTGFSGLGMGLTVEGEILHGEAGTFWDFPRERQTAHVSARRVGCGNK